MNNSNHTYPPGSIPLPKQLDPDMVMLVQNLVANQTAQMSEAFQKEAAAYEMRWNEMQNQACLEKEALEAELQAVTAKLRDTEIRLSSSFTASSPSDNNTASPQSPPVTPHKKAAFSETSSRSAAPVSPKTARSTSARSASTPSKKVSGDAPSVTPTKSTPAKKVKKAVTPKRASETHRLLSTDLPDDVGGLQKAMQLHVRLLWGLLDTKQIPQDPPSLVLKAFDTNFKSADDVYRMRTSDCSLISPTLVQIGASIAVNAKGRIAQQVRQVEEHMLEFMQSMLARYGLPVWRPALSQTPYSLYNVACRIIAIDTFKQALISHTYASLRPNIAYVRNMDLHIRMYDHFVHHHLASRYKKEHRKPGSVSAADTASPIYKGRKRLADARLKFLKDNNYPRRYQEMIDVKATSDDEADPDGYSIGGKVVYWIKKRPERSVYAEQFIRLLDKKREEDVRRDPSRRWCERLHMVPQDSNREESKFISLPKSLPIDYFDPVFFNSLQPRLRGKITSLKVALLPDVSLSFLRHPDEKLSDSAFNKKHAEETLAQYDVDDIVYDGDNDYDSDNEDDDMFEDDEAEEEDFKAERDNLTANLDDDIDM